VNEQDGFDHEPPDLVGLLAGELSRQDTVAAAHHLEGCPACTRELVDLIVAHAALRSSVRVTHLLSAHDDESVPTLASAVSDPEGADGSPKVPEEPPLPPLVTSPGGASSAGAPRHPGRARRVRHLAAAAVVLLLVIGAVVATLAARTSGPTGPVRVAAAPLHPIMAPAGATGSVAVFADGSTRALAVEARRLPSPAAQSYYEVWLLDPATRKMLPMGVLSPSGRGSYSVSAAIMAGYSAVDISLQANDGNPAHSQTSVLRAEL